MAFRITGIKQESHQILVRAPGHVSPAVCDTNLQTCCGSGVVTTECCPGGALQTLAFVAEGSVGLSGDAVTFSGDLTADEGLSSWSVDPVGGSGGLGSADTALSLTLYCIDSVWWVEGSVTTAAGVTYRFEKMLDDDGFDLSATVTVGNSGLLAIVIEHPCAGGGFDPGECVTTIQCGNCFTISTQWTVYDNLGNPVAPIRKVNTGECRFHATDGTHWKLVYDDGTTIWTLTAPDGRQWVQDLWACCGTNTMTSTTGGPSYSVRPVYDCCGSGSGGTPPILTACCPNSIPQSLTLTVSGVGTFPMTWNGTDWQTGVVSLGGGVTANIGFLCSTPGNSLTFGNALPAGNCSFLVDADSYVISCGPPVSVSASASFCGLGTKTISVAP